MTIRLGLIGCGRIADKHIGTIASLPASFSLAAVSDISEERMDAAANHYRNLLGSGCTIRRFKEYEMLVKDPEIDAVVITTLSGLHARIALAAIRAGKPVMLEKPVALTLKEADIVIAESEHMKVPVLVCHQLRYRPMFARLKELIQDSNLGRLLYASVSLRIRRDTAYYSAAPWRGSWEHDGGMLVNQGIHLLDLMLWYMGDAAWIRGQMFRIPDAAKETEDAAVASIQFTSGSAGIMDANTVTYPANLEQSLHIFGEKGTVAIGGESFHRIIRWEVPGVPQAGEGEWADDRTEHKRMYEDFMESIQYGKKPLMNARESKRALELIFGLYRSHLAKQTVRLPAGDFPMEDLKNPEVWDG